MKKIIAAVMIAATAFLPQQKNLFAQDQPEEAKDLGRAAYEQPEKNHEVEGSEALEMITERMKDLTGSLQEMPEIPQLNQTIMIPGGDLKPQAKAAEKTADEQNQPSETKQKENTL